MAGVRTDGEAMEMAALRRQEAAHIDGVDPDVVRGLAWAIQKEARQRYPIDEIHGVYVAGSWARGEAIPGISDIDVRVVVDYETADEYIHDAADYFKNEWSADNCPYPFGYVDLWLAPAEPGSAFVEVADVGGESGD